MRVILLGLGLMLSPATSMATEPTNVVTYEPFQGNALHAGFKVSSKVQGYCWDSEASLRPDAWRCMAGNSLWDPCFSSAIQGSPAVACPGSPFSKTVILMHLTKPLPKRTAVRSDLMPWGLQLADGARCQIVTGATGLKAGMPVRYGCNDWRGCVLGDNIDRSAQPWRVFYMANCNGSRYVKAAVREAVL